MRVHTFSAWIVRSGNQTPNPGCEHIMGMDGLNRYCQLCTISKKPPDCYLSTGRGAITRLRNDVYVFGGGLVTCACGRRVSLCCRRAGWCTISHNGNENTTFSKSDLLFIYTFIYIKKEYIYGLFF